MEMLGDFVCTKYNYMLPKIVAQKETGEYMLEMSKKEAEKSTAAPSPEIMTSTTSTGGSYQK